MPDPFRLWLRDRCGSTNDEACRLGEGGAGSGAVVVAGVQTAGRGRRGASWFADPADSLAMSILWRPHAAKPLWPRLALATGLAVAEACERHIPLAGVKWPNDVWINGRKVAGILVEAGADFVVVGIGINVNTRDFPAEIAGRATSLAVECGTTIERAALLAEIISRFACHAAQIDAGFPAIVQGVNHRCVLHGNTVEMTSPSGRLGGRCEGVGPGGELLIRHHNGRLERVIQADDVRLCRTGR